MSMLINNNTRCIPLLLLLLCFCQVNAKKIIYDDGIEDIVKLITKENVTYIIRYHHDFERTINIPHNCNLKFEGGSLKGNIVFNETKLSGDVNIKGSRISGKITNKVFDASWLCYKDGVTDDACYINDMIAVCGKIYFPKGKYRLISKFNAPKLPVNFENRYCDFHLGIYKSNVSIIGENGTEFISTEELGTLCILSQPNQISNSVSNIRIENIKFIGANDGRTFHEIYHLVNVMGVDGLVINSCSFENYWGDAICLNHYGDDHLTGERTRNKNVKIIKNYICGGDHYNNRNGISVVNGMNVVIMDNTIMKTGRKDMPGGIDIEPVNSAFTIRNIKISNNVFRDIKGTAGAMGIVILRDNAPAHKIIITNNTVKNSKTGVSVVILTNNSTDNFVIKNNYFDENTRPYFFLGEGESSDWQIIGNVFAKKCSQNIPGNIKVNHLIVKKNVF